MAITKLNTGTGTERFSKIALLSIFICKRSDWTTKAQLVDVGTGSVWKDVGDTKTGQPTTIEGTKEFTPILTHEKGKTPFGNIISDQSLTIKFELAMVNETVKQYVAQEFTSTGIENVIGKLATEYSLRLHASEDGDDYSKDTIIPRCNIKVNVKKTSGYGDYESLPCEASVIFEEDLVAGKSLLTLIDLTVTP